MVLLPTYLEDFEGQDNPPQHVEGQVGAETTHVDALLAKVTDEQLLQEITDNLRDSEGETQQLRNSQQVGRAYLLGDQFKDWPWPMEHPLMENRVFMSVSTLIPMITANAGDPDIRCLLEIPDQAELTQSYMDTLTSMLLFDYNVDLALKATIRKIITHWFEYRIGVGKFRIDPMTDKRVFEAIDPRNIVVPTKNSAKGWLAEYKENTVAELLVLFPKATELLTKKFGKVGEKLGPAVLGTRVGYWEYWRDTFVCWKLDDDILDKRLNPHWDWTGIKKVTGNMPQALPDGSMVNQQSIDTFRFNILERPTMPYMIFNHFNWDGQLFDDTGYIEQIRSVQDSLNHRKQQISQIADDSGILVASGEAISEDEFSKYDPFSSAGTTFWMPSGNAATGFHRLEPAQVSPGMIQDMQDNRQIMDDIFGTQPITRGQFIPGEPRSAIAQQIMKQGDQNRVSPIAEEVEDFLQKVYMYDIQMHMLYTDTDYTVPIANISSTADYKNMVFNRNKVPMVKVERTLTIDGIEKKEAYMTPIPITLTVRKASTLPKDPADEYNQMLTLNQAGLGEPLSLYEDMGLADPVSRLERLIKYKTNPVLLLPPDKQREFLNEQQLFAEEQAAMMQPQIGPDGQPMASANGATNPLAALSETGTTAPAAANKPNGGVTSSPMAPNSAKQTPQTTSTKK